MTSFGQAAFVGIGAYTTAVLTTDAGWSPWVTLFIGLLITFVVAYILGAITLRLSGHYLPLGTIAWRSEEHTSELQSLMRISYAVFCLKKKKNQIAITNNTIH